MFKTYLSKILANHDLLLHGSLSFIIMIHLILLFNINIITAVIITFIIGILKEIYDYYDYGNFCLYDISYNILGISYALLFIIMLKYVNF
jgi:hypothetical protein